MIEAGLRGVEFIAINTDAQALSNCRAPVKLQLGMELTRGLGAGANPEVGRNAALEADKKIFDLLDGRVARMTNRMSEFGVQLDSIADVISFGIAPAGRWTWKSLFSNSVLSSPSAAAFALIQVSAASTDAEATRLVS